MLNIKDVPGRYLRAYLLKPGTSRNQPKPTKVTQKIAKRRKATPNFKIGEICDFLQAFVIKILSSNTQIWAFGSKCISFLSRNFVCTLFRRCWFQIRHLLSVVLSSLVPRLHKPIQCLRFATYLKKDLSGFFCFFFFIFKIFSGII